MTGFKLLSYREEVCNDPEHEHQTELQQMATVEAYGLQFDVTRDGDSFNVRHADWEPIEGLTLEQVQTYMIACALTGGA